MSKVISPILLRSLLTPLRYIVSLPIAEYFLPKIVFIIEFLIFVKTNFVLSVFPVLLLLSLRGEITKYFSQRLE